MNYIKKRLVSMVLTAASLPILFTSCLDLGPLDYYGSESYWKTPEQVEAYVDGIHKHLRDAAWQHTMTFGELRGGHFVTTTSADGMGVSYGSILLQNFSEVNTGVTKFGDLYGRITNLNLFIARVTNATYLTQEKKNYFLGQVYGLRAFYYFDLYRVYGGVPLRLTADVVEGVINPSDLYMPRSTPKEVMAQIKSDIEMSLEYFGDENRFNPFNRGNKVYWSKAATECLKGEVYLWTSKVTTGDDVADQSNLSIAKESFTNVMNNYSLGLETDFTKIFDVNTKAGKEVIFAIRYAEGEATNGYWVMLYNMATGFTKDRYNEYGELFGDPLGVKSTANQSVEYDKKVYLTFDDEDTRKRATFLTSYNKDLETGELTLFGTHVQKNIGTINAAGNRIYSGDMIFYRLPLIYSYMAEIANMEGNGTDVAHYLNLIRERAYGANWDEAQHGYTPGDFTQNELAILAEKDKEFITEGQRWWDLRRMTITKGGKPLVFSPEANIVGDNPILTSDEEHKLLWPLERSLLDNDPALTQTPGY
ncbi:MAG: RagB/SusD family nutrient uptake outer membrane protein [Bacteroidales bacterium]